ncbi:hypothetical protein M949_2046 [Riemerella anatipestifer CH3]|nr:hypothetical protein M949_2046 [Riemerella anatipestifer CH3]
MVEPKVQPINSMPIKKKFMLIKKNPMPIKSKTYKHRFF